MPFTGTKYDCAMRACEETMAGSLSRTQDTDSDARILPVVVDLLDLYDRPVICTMMRAPFQSAIKSFAVCRIHTQRTIFRCFGPSHQCQNQWQRKREAVWQGQSFHAALRRVFHHKQDPSVSDATLPEVTAKVKACKNSRWHEERWQNQYLELKKFYDEHGHSVVPRRFGEKQLVIWVRTQRDVFKNGILSEYRVQKLSELDFCFNVHDAIWMEKYEELKVYKALYGDTLIPKGCPSNPSLANWVCRQRMYYVGRLKEKSHLISDVRIALLEAIDFAWYPKEARRQMMSEELKEHHRISGRGTHPSPKEARWQMMFEELKEHHSVNRPAKVEACKNSWWHDERWQNQYLELKKFYDEHGHSVVARRFGEKELANWVRTQRDFFKNGTLSEYRVQKLSELDFCFNVQDAIWMEKYEELKVYKALYGDTLIPKGCPSNPVLASWVRVQRMYYVGRLKEKSHLISDERIALLEAIDFAWYPKEARRQMMSEELKEHHRISGPGTHPPPEEARWQMMFEELKEHHRINRPGTYPSPASHAWIRRQRKQYQGYREGKKVPLTAERLEKLRSIKIYL